MLGHAQLVHGLDYATPTWHARAGSGGLVHFQVPTDPWYIFKCPRVVHFGCPPRLLGLPWRVALALRQRGWLLISDIIWHKPNAMPSSSPRRPTTDHEYIFLFAKGPGYYYDADAIREPTQNFYARVKDDGRTYWPYEAAAAHVEAGEFAGQLQARSLQGLAQRQMGKTFHPFRAQPAHCLKHVPLVTVSRCLTLRVYPIGPSTAMYLFWRYISRPWRSLIDFFLGSGTTAVGVARLLGQ